MKMFGLLGRLVKLARKEPCGREVSHRLHQVRLWLELQQGGNSSHEAAQLLQMGRATLYRWAKRLNEQGLQGLRPKSRRPHRLRQRRWNQDLVKAVCRLRKEQPLWGKLKITAVLRREGVACSIAAVGRILSREMRRRAIREVRWFLGRKFRVKPKRVTKRPHARRLPKELRGKLFPAQLDTITLSKDRYGVERVQFSAVDPVTRVGAAKVYRAGTANNGRDFLEHVRCVMPWVPGIQVDGGGEFKGAFEEACRSEKIPLYVLPPRSPKLNGYVERFNGTCRYELYNRQESLEDLAALEKRVSDYEHFYNTYRPHQGLKQTTPYDRMREKFPHQGRLSLLSQMW